jgi:hypothetical protein
VAVDIERTSEYEFYRRRFGSNPSNELLSEWLIEQQVEEAVINIRGAVLATGLGSARDATGGRPTRQDGVGAMSGKQHQAQPNRGGRGRKKEPSSW